MGISSRLNDVVEVYEHALFSYWPRARYVVGIFAKLFFLPLQYLPEWLGDWLFVKVMYRLPTPAACRIRR